MTKAMACGAAIVVCAMALAVPQAAGEARGLPEPLEGHPGNIFLQGEPLCIEGPEEAASWVVEDVDGAVIAGGSGAAARCEAPVGWYRARFQEADGGEAATTALAVLRKLEAPIPQDSPVCLDMATAWFASRYSDPNRMQRVFSSLAALAGVNWTRDRLTWGELEPVRGQFPEETKYDASAAAQTAQGLNVLQVFHHTPQWAMEESTDRFPGDLRDVYRFCRAMAQRFEGRVDAWEPWNEADIERFGGHAIVERCAYQKAAYLGFKAGDPDVTVCWNVNAIPEDVYQTEGVLANEVWPYFDTFNIHTYAPPEMYDGHFGPARESASGRPLWLTECGKLMRFSDSGSQEPAWEEQLEQARFVPRSYASSLFAGVAKHFFFLLPSYAEGNVQFSLCHYDMTPRPSYVALAAAGRLLAGAEALGRMGHGFYAFRAKPDGQPREVVVVWGEERQRVVDGLPLENGRIYDHFGREVAAGRVRTGPDPLYVVMPAGSLAGRELEPPRDTGDWRRGRPSRVVLQPDLSGFTTRLGDDTHEIPPGHVVEIPIHAYNFGQGAARGRLASLEAPKGWSARTPAERIEMDPMERKPVALKVTVPTSGTSAVFGDWVKMRWNFGPLGESVLALRLAAPAGQVEPAAVRPLAFANEPARWEDNVMRGASMRRLPAEDGGVAFAMQFAETDPWGYPRLPLPEDARPQAGDHGLALTLELAEGPGVVRVQFIEEGGAGYLAGTGMTAAAPGPQRVFVLFRHAMWGAYSEIDPNGELDPEQISAVLVGINSEEHAAVRLVARDLAWVRY